MLEKVTPLKEPNANGRPVVSVSEAREKAEGLASPIPDPIRLAQQAPPLWDLKKFLDIPTKAKEPIVDGLLYRRDLVALVGRRRNGKTTFIIDLAVSIAGGKPFLGYTIDHPHKVVLFLLEDDTREIQEKFISLINSYGETAYQNLFIFTREYFQKQGILIGAEGAEGLPFTRRVRAICDACRPDLIVIDNAAQLLGGNINDHKVVHAMTILCRDLSQTHNCAVLVAAHPRKVSERTPSLLRDPEAFFDEIMGSSIFMNSFGSLWGIERHKDDQDKTYFLGGAQRFTGTQNALALRKLDNGQFELIDNWAESFELACRTEKRRKAWDCLPAEFTFNDAYRACTAHISSKHSFNDWLQHCLRVKLIVKAPNGSYSKRPKVEPNAEGEEIVVNLEGVGKGPWRGSVN